MTRKHGPPHGGHGRRPGGTRPSPAERAQLEAALGRLRAARTPSPETPAWRQRLDAVVDDAVAEVLSDGLVRRPDGGLDITFDRRLAATHGLPALAAVLDGLRDGLAASGPDGPLKEQLVGLVENVRTGLAGEAPPPRGAPASSASPASGADAPPTASVGTEAPASPPPEEPPARPAAQPLLPDPRVLLEGLFARATSRGPAPGSASPVASGAEGEPPPAPSGLPGGPRSSGAEPSEPSGRPTVSIDLAGILSGLLSSVASPRPRARPEGEP